MMDCFGVYESELLGRFSMKFVTRNGNFERILWVRRLGNGAERVLDSEIARRNRRVLEMLAEND